MLAFVFWQRFLNVGKIKTCPLFDNRLLPDLLFHTGFTASTPPTSKPPPQRREIRFYCLSDNHANVKAVECSTNRSRWTWQAPPFHSQGTWHHHIWSRWLICRPRAMAGWVEPKGRGYARRQSAAVMFSMTETRRGEGDECVAERVL